MTNDEAIKEFQSELRWAELNEYPYISKKKVEADKMAIKALKQEFVLDKIRAEISAMMPPLGNWMYEEGHIVEQTACEVIADVLQILDKYKVEGDDKE